MTPTTATATTSRKYITWHVEVASMENSREVNVPGLKRGWMATLSGKRERTQRGHIHSPINGPVNEQASIDPLKGRFRPAHQI
jgi:hypothetical protein